MSARDRREPHHIPSHYIYIASHYITSGSPSPSGSPPLPRSLLYLPPALFVPPRPSEGSCRPHGYKDDEQKVLSKLLAAADEPERAAARQSITNQRGLTSALAKWAAALPADRDQARDIIALIVATDSNKEESEEKRAGASDAARAIIDAILPSDEDDEERAALYAKARRIADLNPSDRAAAFAEAPSRVRALVGSIRGGASQAVGRYDREGEGESEREDGE